MQPYFGSLEALNDPRNKDLLRRHHSPNSSPKAFLARKQKESLSSLRQNEPRQAKVTGIKVNVSGKCFQVSLRELAKYPKSLLSDQRKRSAFFDSKRDEYFFDHNRVVAESVSLFYQYGHLDQPENIPEHLFVEEIAFYGLYEYITQESRDRLVDLQRSFKVKSSKLWRDKLWVILESPDVSGHNVCARAYNIFSLSLILFSIFLLCYGTYVKNELHTLATANFQDVRANWVFLSETICIGYFTVELFLRFIVSREKLRFICSFLNVIDFVAIAPFYINIFLDIHRITAPLSVLRVLRIGKIFRVLKISRYNTSLLILGKTLYSSRWDLWMLYFLLSILCLFFGSITYYLEQIFVTDTNQLTSIPTALWWALMTMLSVGYGNMVPQSIAGRIAGGLCAVSGVIIVAPILPIIFNRWTRFNRLENEAKLHKKCKRFNEHIQQDFGDLNFIRVNSLRRKGRFNFV